METPDDVGMLYTGTQPRWPYCGVENDVWGHRKPKDWEWYTYTCGGCGRQYRWMMHVEQRFYVIKEVQRNAANNK